ncbi:MAG: hypothetical protein NTV44_03325, partial [Firmicutes bacterium]|nr:hypothetical protein [Bacillota bacterium]
MEKCENLNFIDISYGKIFLIEPLKIGEPLMFKRIRKFISLMEQKKARLLILVSIIIFNIALWVITSTLAYFIDPARYGNFFNALLTSGMSWI